MTSDAVTNAGKHVMSRVACAHAIVTLTIQSFIGQNEGILYDIM